MSFDLKKLNAEKNKTNSSLASRTVIKSQDTLKNTEHMSKQQKSGPVAKDPSMIVKTRITGYLTGGEKEAFIEKRGLISESKILRLLVQKYIDGSINLD